jgi:hypothetical protein
VHALLIKISPHQNGPEESVRIEEIAKAFGGREAVQINYSYDEKEGTVSVCVMSSNTITQFSTEFRISDSKIMSTEDRK